MLYSAASLRMVRHSYCVLDSLFSQVYVGVVRRELFAAVCDEQFWISKFADYLPAYETMYIVAIVGLDGLCHWPSGGKVDGSDDVFFIVGFA